MVRTQEEDLVDDTLLGIHVQLLDRGLEIGPSVGALVGKSKVVVKLPPSAYTPCIRHPDAGLLPRGKSSIFA